MKELLEQFCALNGYTISEQFSQEPRAEKRCALPYGYTDQLYADILLALGIKDAQLWEHQAEALEAISSGLNAVLSTDTASGKSLIFQLASIHKLKSRQDDARVLVFYPTRALNNDQTNSWRKIMAAAGYPAESLAVIDGSIPITERMARLEKAHVLLMTPDTTHAWLMANLDEAPVRKFMAQLNLKVLDEAGLYDGAFGTHMSYLMRRMLFAQRTLNPDFREEDHDQIIMAAATLDNPERFAVQLTGRYAWTIEENKNTSPRYHRDFTVIRTPDFKRRLAVQKLLQELGSTELDGSILTFMDSRRGVDEMAQDVNRALGNEAFAAYRSGLTGEDRVAIEERLRQASQDFGQRLRGAITTSALEVGIDIAGITHLVLEGVPAEASSFKQRVGRLRHGGSIVIIEEDRNLRARKGSVEQHFLNRPRQPVFYRSNTKVQAEQAICLLNEARQMGMERFPRTSMSWPAGFIEAARAYEQAPQQLTEIQRQALPPANIDPHLFHGLRSTDGPTRRLMLFQPSLERSISVGEVSQGQALQEALPGMVVYANGRRYRVRNWTERERGTIWVRHLTDEEFGGHARTRAMVKTEARVYLNDMTIIRGRFKKNGDANFMADLRLSIEKSATGFVEMAGRHTRRFLFDMKRTEEEEASNRPNQTTIFTPNYRPARKQLFDTTGVVIRIGENVMGDRDLYRLAALMTRALCLAANISPNDVGSLVRNVSVGVSAGNTLTDRAIVIYDKTPGSLFFSGKVFTKTDAIIEQMIDLMEPNDAEMSRIVDAFITWQDKLKRAKVPTYDQWLSRDTQIDPAAHQIEAYALGSELIMHKNDVAEWVRIMGAEIIHSTLMYRVNRVSKFNPFASKVSSGKPEIRYKAADYTTPIFARNDQLERPGLPTYRLAIFNTRKNRYEDDSQPRTVNGVRSPKAGSPPPPPRVSNALNLGDGGLPDEIVARAAATADRPDALERNLNRTHSLN